VDVHNVRADEAGRLNRGRVGCGDGLEKGGDGLDEVGKGGVVGVRFGGSFRGAGGRVEFVGRMEGMMCMMVGVCIYFTVGTKL
jgi:hypothetical protein